MKLDRAKLALAVAVTGVAVAGEAHAHGVVRGEGDEAEAVGDELVVENRGVGVYLDEVDGDGGDLGDHDAAEGVGHARVRLPQLELAVVVLQVADADLWEPLVRDRRLH